MAIYFINYLFNFKKFVCYLEENRNVESQGKADHAAEEDRRRIEMKIADKQKSQDEHIQRLQTQMIEYNKRQQQKKEEVLAKCLKDQNALMEQVFREKTELWRRRSQILING